VIVCSFGVVGEGDFGWMDVWVLNLEWFGRRGRSPSDLRWEGGGESL